jgi:elongator complex protein 3
MHPLNEIIEEIKKDPSKNLEELKLKIARKYRLDSLPANSEILACLTEEDSNILAPLLMRKPVRTISGIAVVAVMTKPSPCPGKCIYCPRGENAPQSYTGKEPATLRAKRANYDPYLQVTDRLKQLEQIGHPIDKVELIVMGGTFPAQPEEYQKWFIKRCIEAMNHYRKERPMKEVDWEKVQQDNERGIIRNTGITIETRPDYAKEEHVDNMLEMGVTRVELGVQTIYNDIYERVRRGHTVEDVIKATQVLRDAGMKVGYHIMPGLFSEPRRDIKMFKKIFQEDRFKPDFIKIYPTLVIEGTELYELWRKGEYSPYSDEEALKLICEVKKMMPKWIRTMRIQRDVPSYLVEAGVKKSDLGDLVYKRLKEEKIRCKCIRCRDIGHLAYKEGVKLSDNLEILKEEYSASGGMEYFLSIEDRDNDALIAYLRLRFPSEEAHRLEVDENTSLIRELRVLGPLVPLGERRRNAEQHKGWGETLLRKAEEISRENGFSKLLITSAIGTRYYYRRFGYERIGPYMGKII